MVVVGCIFKDYGITMGDSHCREWGEAGKEGQPGCDQRPLWWEVKGQTPLGEDQYGALSSRPRLPLLSPTYAAPFLMEISWQQQQQVGRKLSPWLLTLSASTSGTPRLKWLWAALAHPPSL